MKRFGISIHDNDFQMLFKRFFRVLEVDARFLEDKLTKDEIARLWNANIRGLLAFQNIGGKRMSNARELQLAEYLTITPDRVHVDDDVDHYIQRYGPNCNMEFYVLDWRDPSRDPYYFEV